MVIVAVARDNARGPAHYARDLHGAPHTRIRVTVIDRHDYRVFRLDRTIYAQVIPGPQDNISRGIKYDPFGYNNIIGSVRRVP